MTDTELYHQLLGLTAPWQVSHIELNPASQQVRVYVTYDVVLSQLLCPECGQTGACYDLREERTWRHLDSCQFQTFLVVRLPRVECPAHGVKTIAAPWCEPHSRFTLAFECFAITLLLSTGVQSKTAALLGLNPGQVHDIMVRAVARGLSRRDQEAILKHLSLDEKSFQKGHHYITVLGDSTQRRVLDVVQSRTQQATETLLQDTLSPAQREQVQSVSMDMWLAFAQAKEQVLPAAETVHDRFHIAQYLSEAVDKTRRDEHRVLAQAGVSPLTKSKWVWLRSPEKLTDTQKALFTALQSHDLETAKVWSFKEAFRGFFTVGSVEEGQAFFDNWYATALELGNKHLTKVAQMLYTHLTGLLAYLRHKTNNAIAEGLNAQIQLIKARARGFRKFAHFRIAILFFLGKLDLSPQESP